MTEGTPFTFMGPKDVGDAGTALLKEKSAVELRLARPGQQIKQIDGDSACVTRNTSAPKRNFVWS
jgi:hypothetical protein